jgi:L-rhamnose 1-dehydrogenase
MAGDIAQPHQARAFVDFVTTEFGRIDVLVANAGIARFHDFISTPDDWIQDHLRVNVGGAYYVTREAGRVMEAQGRGGSIIAISSISAHTGSAALVHYTPTKAAVCNLMQSAAVALGPHGIRCNALLPGTIETQLNKDDLAVESKRKAATERTALKRLGKPEDMAGPAVFLASDLSQYVTGAQILVDGGSFVNFQ